MTFQEYLMLIKREILLSFGTKGITSTNMARYEACRLIQDFPLKIYAVVFIPLVLIDFLLTKLAFKSAPGLISGGLLTSMASYLEPEPPRPPGTHNTSNEAKGDPR